ncbi:MAG: Gfo/Idh/MocA family oxidoreductase [bacterium]|nr:Gfo/Idh/MocA family oxidoreductase [bacterium]
MNTNQPVKVAVLGAGYLGRFHAQKYAALPTCELVAVVDTDPARAAAVADECGCDAAGDVAEIVDRIDAASVVVPTVAHHQVAMPLLEAGRHVLLEKPIAPDLAAADDLVAAAARSGVILQIGHLERFNPAIRALAERVDRPLFVEAHRLGVYSGRATDVDIVVDLMIHDIDILLHLVDRPITAIQAVGSPVLTGQVDIANARLEFVGGCTANLTASRVSVQDKRKFRVFQPGSFLAADCAAQANQFATLPPGGGPSDIMPEAVTHPKADNLLTEIEAFVGAIRGENAVAVGGREAREALAVALTITEDIDRRAREYAAGG